MKDTFPKGITSRISEVYLRKTDGTPYTGLTHATAGLQAYYKRNTASGLVAVALVDIVTLGTYVSGGFKEVSAANAPGLYEVHLPNAMLVAGAASVVLTISGASGTLDDLESNNSEFKLEEAARWYEGAGAYLDDGNGSAGIVPGINGVASLPSAGMSDAKAICNSVGLNKIFVGGAGPYTLPNDSFSGYKFVGVAGLPQINLANRVIDNAYAEGVELTGQQGGTGILRTLLCTLDELDKIRGRHDHACIKGDISIDGATIFVDCHDAIPGDVAPGCTFNNHGIPLQLRGYKGDFEVKEMGAGDTVDFDGVGGQIIFNANCADGEARVFYPMTYVDNSDGAVKITYVHPDAVYSGSVRNGGDGLKLIQLGTDAPSTEAGMDRCEARFSKGLKRQVEIGVQYDSSSNKLLALRQTLKEQVDDSWQVVIVPYTDRWAVNDGITRGGSINSAILNDKANNIDPSVYIGQTFGITADSNLSDGTRRIAAAEIVETDRVQVSWTLPFANPVAAGMHYEILMPQSSTPEDNLIEIFEDNGQGTTWSVKDFFRANFTGFFGKRGGGGAVGTKTMAVPGSAPDKVRVAVPTDNNGNSTGDTVFDLSDI